MEREGYHKRINELLNAVSTLLDANKAMGERVAELEKTADAYEALKARCEKLEGELAMRKRAHHGKGSEKPKAGSSPAKSEKTKDEDEEDYIDNGSRNDTPPEEADLDEDTVPDAPRKKKPRDTSNRPEHNNTCMRTSVSSMTAILRR